MSPPGPSRLQGAVHAPDLDLEDRLYCLEKIIDVISDGIVMSDSEGRVVLYNRTEERLEDLKAEDMVGKLIWEAYNYNSEELSEHRAVFRSGKAILNAYRSHTNQLGAPRYVSYCTYPIEKDGKRLGAFSVSKNEDKLQALLAETIELRRLSLGGDHGADRREERKNGTTYTFSDIVGTSEATLISIREAETIAMLDNTVLIIGETGTGKEVYAQSIHNFSRKGTEPFVAVNCAAIPETLMESILYGSVRGAFTGAQDHVGMFEEAGAGTLFLDEINSMPIAMQTKLLRVIQERKVRRVGGMKTIPVECRIMCAMNEDPQTSIREGKLRQDLFYRISGLSLYIIPLRERPGDILDLVKALIERNNRRLSRQIKFMSGELQEALLAYSWPGNVRELEHFIENLMIRHEANQVELSLAGAPKHLLAVLSPRPAKPGAPPRKASLSQCLRDIERGYILESLDRNGWKITRTAEDLGIIRQSLIYRMKKLNILFKGRD